MARMKLATRNVTNVGDLRSASIIADSKSVRGHRNAILVGVAERYPSSPLAPSAPDRSRG
jgi:hypothetical protein